MGPPLNQFSTSVATSVTVVNETQWLQSITHFALIFPPSCFKSFLSSSKPPEHSGSPPESSEFEPYPSVFLPVVPPLGNIFYVLTHLLLTSLSTLLHHHHDLRLFTFLSTCQPSSSFNIIPLLAHSSDSIVFAAIVLLVLPLLLLLSFLLFFFDGVYFYTSLFAFNMH